MTTLYENNVSAIHWDESANIIDFTWRGPIPQKGELQEPLTKVVEFVKEKKAFRYLGNNLNQPILTKENNDLVNQTAGALAGAGVRYLGLVVPASVLSGMSVKDAVQTVADTMQLNTFDDPEKASAWLREQN